MRHNSNWKLWTCTGGIILAGLAVTQATDAQTVTGNLSTTGVNYGSNVPGSGALAVQTVDSLFGSSQLDAAYGVVSNNSLYLFIAGNLQNNGNILQIWIDAAPGGQNTLANIPSTAGSMNTENGSIFSPGFSPSYALEFNVNKETQGGVAGTYGVIDAFNLTGTPVASFLGYFPVANGTVGSTQSGGDLTAMQVAYDYTSLTFSGTNTLGIPNGSATSGALLPSNATPLQVTTGIEFGIPLSLLGNPTSNIEVLAGLNGGGDSGLSNQLLPGLPASTAVSIGGTLGQPDIKTSTSPYYVTGATKEFNLSSTSDQYFTVPVTSVANGIWNPNGGSSSGSWANAADWSNSYIPHLAGDDANFANASAPATVLLNGSYSVGTLSFNSANSFTIAPGSGGTLSLSNGSNTAVVVNFSGQHTLAVPVVLTSNALLNAQSHGTVIDVTGNISGTGSLTTSAATNSAGGGAAYSAIVLSGSNTYTGPTIIQTGILQLGSPTALPADSNLSLLSAANSALDLNGISASVSSISDAGAGVSTSGIINSNTTAGTAVFTYAGTLGNPSVFAGNISDSFAVGGNVTELNILSGSLTLTGTNSYAGGTTVAPSAMLQIASVGGFGSALSTLGAINNNGSLIISDMVEAGTITGNGVATFDMYSSVISSLKQTGGLVDNSGLEIIGPAVTGPISGTGELTIDRSLQLVGGPSTIAALNLSGGAVMDLDGTSVTVDSWPGSGGATIGNSSTSTGAMLIYAGGSDQLSAAIQDGINGTGSSVSVSVVSGQLSLNGSNSYSGGSSISSGATLQINAAGALPVGGAVVNNGTFDVEANSVSGNISGSGTLIVGNNGTTVLQLKSGAGVSSVGSLSVSGSNTSSVDLTNNTLLINYGSGNDPIATVQQYLADGFAAGWAGGELMSSSVATLNASSTVKYSVGYIDGANPPVNFSSSVGSGTIEVMPTLAGDATLSGTVNFYDFQVVLSNFGKASQSWDQGDFDYTGSVDFYDFQVVLSNFGQHSGALSSVELARLDSFASQFGKGVVEGTDGGLSLVSVPEPASVGLLGVAGVGLMSRRRRRR